MVKNRIDIVKGSDGRVQSGTIYFGNMRKLKFTHEFDDFKMLRAVEFEGKTADLPSLVDLYFLVNNRYIEAIRKPFNYYDRNALGVFRHHLLGRGALAKIFGVVWTYTVPANRNAFVESCNVATWNHGTAALNGAAGCYIFCWNKDLSTAVYLARSYLTPLSAAGAQDKQIGTSMALLQAGETLDAWDFSDNTAVNTLVSTQASAKITEFDV